MGTRKRAARVSACKSLKDVKMAMASGDGDFLRGEASDGAAAAAALQESGQLHQSISEEVMKFSCCHQLIRINRPSNNLKCGNFS